MKDNNDLFASIARSYPALEHLELDRHGSGPAICLSALQPIINVLRPRRVSIFDELPLILDQHQLDIMVAKWGPSTEYFHLKKV